MKTKIFLLFFLLYSLGALCQDSLPKSYVNIGIGFGQSSGGLGIKTVIGYKNSGLLVGIGYLGHEITGYKIGGQISFKRFYVEVGYGVVAYTYHLNNGLITPFESFSALLGGMISLGKEKRIFIDLGGGFSFRAPQITVVNPEKYEHFICFNIGVGYRISKIKL